MSVTRLEDTDVIMLCDALEEQRENCAIVAAASEKRGNLRVAATRRHMAERFQAMRLMLINARDVNVVDYEEEPKQVADLTCGSCIAQDGSAHARHCEHHSPGDQRLAAEQKLLAAIASFPERFGLRGFPGDVFRVSKRDSYVGDNMEPVIYTERETQNAGNVTFWQAFSKASPEEVRRNLVEKP